MLILIISLFSYYSDSYGQEKIRLYNATLKSTDINGTKNFNVKNFPSTSKTISDPLLAPNPIYWIGKILSQKNLRQHKTLLDLANEETFYPLLDSIDMDFYTNYSLKNVLDKRFVNDTLYLNFRKTFKKAQTIKQKKDILTENIEYSKFFDALLNSKYQVDSIIISNNSEVEKEIKLGIKLNLDTLVLSKNLQGSAGIRSELYRLVDQSITVEGFYYDVRYSKEYLSKVIFYLTRKYLPAIEEIKSIKDKDQFTSTLVDFYSNRYSSLIAGSAILKLVINYDVTKISKNSLSAMISTKAQIPNVELLELSGDLQAAFGLDKKFDGVAKTENYYCVSYAYDGDIATFNNF